MDHIIRKKKAQKQGRVYFTKETEAAIVKYNRSSDKEERSELYQNHIHWPFYKLTENIIHTFKFYYTDGVENLEDLQHEIMVFLLSKIHLFNPENGAKAYSYFGTIVKRWLIVYNQKNYGKKINNISIQDLNQYSQLDISDPSFIVSKSREGDIETVTENEDITDRNLDETKNYKYEDRLSIFIDQYVEYVTDRIYVLFPKGNDASIADAILELFRKRDNIDVFNKKALYIYIREMVDVKTPKITKIANKLYAIFKEKYLFYLEHGYFPPK
jgi:DNA-directed RNA polymerase specialized sigma subunit